MIKETDRIHHLGVTATRKGLLLPQMGAFIKVLRALQDQIEMFHHGDCIGGDAELHDLCRKTSNNLIHIRGHLPQDESQRAFCECDSYADPLPYLKRNRVIVNSSDLMLAFPKGYTEELRGSGTWATIRYARERKPLMIIYPNGKVQTYNHIFEVIKFLELPNLTGFLR